MQSYKNNIKGDKSPLIFKAVEICELQPSGSGSQSMSQRSLHPLERTGKYLERWSHFWDHLKSDERE